MATWLRIFGVAPTFGEPDFGMVVVRNLGREPILIQLF